MSEQIKPIKFAHAVFRSRRFEETVAWWKNLLHAEPAFENDFIAFITYDDEHHRIAIVRMPGLEERSSSAEGLDHIAYTYATLGDLLATYERLKADGVEPYWCINHGPTTSMYYRDPDGNQVELQIDNFATDEQLKAWFATDAFAKNPIGVEFKPEELLRKFREGVPVEELVQQGSA
ncbi:MAG: VOC family protein [Myxococcales bacterium]|nr:VOC family protein [Myxococcales bacterium]